MSIAEKLLTVGAGLEEISEGINAEATVIADLKSRVDNLPATSSGYNDGFDAGIEQGKQAEYDRFWDAFQQNGERTNYSCAFGGWAGEFKPKHNIAPTSAPRMFEYATISDLKGSLDEQGVTLDLSNCTDFDYAFSKISTSRIPKVNASGSSMLRNTFNGCKAEYIEEIHVTETMSYQNTFSSCANLKDITFVGTIGNAISFSYSSFLSSTSVQSIIDALKDLTGATAQTVTFQKTVGGKITEAQKATITAKNWTLVY